MAPNPCKRGIAWRGALPSARAGGAACRGGRVVEVVNWSRPELFEGFGLDEFSAVTPSNEDEVNAREVR
jgi:hypothetical protein